MATMRDVDRFRMAQEELERALQRDIRGLWNRVRGSSPESIRDAFLEVQPVLVATYGEAAATVGAEYFEGLTGERAVLSEPVPDSDVQESLRATARPLWEGGSAVFLAAALAIGARHMLQYGRSTVYESTLAVSGWAYARVPEAGACAWCVGVAAPGAVYATRGEAGGEGNSFHNNCRCDPVVVQSDNDLPYDRGPLSEMYENAVHFAGSTDDAAVAAALRELYGLA